MKFNLRKINLEKDENYFNQTSYEGFKISYCKEKDLDEKEIKIRYQEFLRTAGNQLDPRKTDYSFYIAEDEIGKYAESFGYKIENHLEDTRITLHGCVISSQIQNSDEMV